MSVVKMPKLSDSMIEGTLLSWLKRDGDEVQRGEELVEIETDKATMTYEAEDTGILRILVPEDSTVEVGAAIAEIHDQREVLPVDVDSADLQAHDSRTDETQAVAPQSPPVPQPRAAEQVVSPSREAQVVALNRTEQIIARRVSESRASVPAFDVEMEVDVTAVLAARATWRSREPDMPIPSLNDFMIKACALALRDFPRVNGAYQAGHLELSDRINVGLVVGVESALLIPTVVDADRKPLHQIANETRELIARARTNTLTPADLEGGTFTLSNLGMFGVTRFSAVINMPQAAILAVGSARKRTRSAGPDRSVLSLTLTCDHRVVYGVDAAQFLSRVRSLLEEEQTATLLHDEAQRETTRS